MENLYPRDLRGYGESSTDACWPDGARIAVQFVLNYEEGGENCLLHGDTASEAFLSEIVGAQPFVGMRHWNMESLYEYGARAGFWRLYRLFTGMKIPLTVYGVATALARSPDQVRAMQSAGWEIASHGYKWIDYKNFTTEAEVEHIHQARELHFAVTGSYPQGWYTGRCSAQTVNLVAQVGAEVGEWSYISDSYADDLPYWLPTPHGVQLMIPYTLDANDMRFASPQGFNAGEQFYQYLKDSFDALYAEGQEGAAKMLSVGLHCRLVGRPGRVMALRRFLEYIQGFEGVWCATRLEIARFWRKHHPYIAPKINVTDMSKAEFVAAFGSVFEHSAWIAEQAYETEIQPFMGGAQAVHSLLCRVFRTAPDARRLEVLRAHPDLAGRLAAAKELTAESTEEQASAGLDCLSSAEKEQFMRLNADYVAKHGFPFILAVKDWTKSEILSLFLQRLKNSRDTEFLTACRQVERIAEFRLAALFGEAPPPKHHRQRRKHD